jgi:excisionase family DNA binding protein
MTPDHEVAIRGAVDELVAALLAVVRAEVAPVPGTSDRLLSIDQAASALGIGRTALYDELTNGRLRSFKVGRRRLIPASAIDAYIETRAAEDPVAPALAAGPFGLPVAGQRTRTPASGWSDAPGGQRGRS